MLKLKSTKSSEENDRIMKALKPSVRNIGTKAASDEQTYQSNPYTIKANILKKLEDDACISKIQVGEGLSFFRLCLTHDDKYAIMASVKDIIVVELATKSIYHTFTNAHYAFIRNIVVTEDYTILSCSRDSTIIAWSIITKQLLFKIDKPHGSSPVNAMTLTADDKYLVSAGDNEIKVWDWMNKKCIRTIARPHKGEINSLLTTKDNKFIISASGDRSIRLWNFETCTFAYRFKNAHYSGVLSIKLSKDDKTLYSASTDGSICIWDLTTMERVHTFFNAHSKHIWRLDLVCQDRFIISPSLDCTMSLWDAETKLHLHTFKNFNEEQLLSLAVTKDERYVIVGSKKGNLYMLDLGVEPDICLVKNAHLKLITGVKTIFNDKLMVTSSHDNFVNLWDMETKKVIDKFISKTVGKIWASAVSQDDKKIALGKSEGIVEMWSLESREFLFKCEGNTNFGVSRLIFTNDGTKLISASHDWSIYIRDANSPKLIHKIDDAHRDRLSTIDITKDDKYLVSGSMDKCISIWDLQNYKKVYTLENAHDAGIFSVKLTNDDRYLLSGSNDKKLKVWDLETMRTVHIFDTSHITSIRNIIISRDDRFIVSIDSRSVIEINSFKTKQRAYVYSGLLGNNSFAASFTYDNKNIIFASYNSLYMFENPFNNLTVQYSDLSKPHSLIRFMPLTSYFSNSSLIHKTDMIRSYPEIKVHPYGWTWFHIAGIFSPCKELIFACLENKIPFTIDIFGKTPLHYMLENSEKDIASINAVLSGFGLILETCQYPFELLTSLSNVFSKIVDLDNMDAVNFLNLYTLEPEPAFKETVDNYGKLHGHHKTCFHVSSSRLYSYHTRENLIAYNNKQKIEVKIIPAHWDYSLSSQDINSVITTLLDVSEQEIFRTAPIQALVTYLWRSSQTFYYLLGFLFSTQAILISIYTGLETRQVGLEIPIFVLSIVFLLYETFQMIYDGLKVYLLSGWSYFDGIGNLLVPGTLIAVWSGMEGETKNWLFSWILFFTYAKWISYFKVYHKTRKLIRVTIEIFKEMRSFAAILAFIIFSFSLIFLQFDRVTPYKTHLLNSYRLLYSDFDLDYISTPAMMFYFVIVIALIAIVLLNMLITIMANTFAEVESRSLIVDSKEKLKLVAENMKVLQTLKLFIPNRKKVGDSETKKYLFYAQRKNEEKSSTQEKLEDQIDVLKKSLKDSKEEIVSLQKRFDEQKDLSLQQARQAEEKIMTLQEKIDKQNELSLQQGKDIMAELAKMTAKYN